MRKALLATALIMGIAPVLSACQNNAPASPAQAQAPDSEQQQLIEKARLTVDQLRGDQNLGGPVNDALSKSRGVLVFPNLIKAGFFFGGAGGQGVLLVRQGQGWSDPVFVYAADASFGLQIGAEGGQVLFAVMNDGAVRKLLNGNADLGGDVSVAVGPWGGGVQGATTPNVGADLLAYSLQQGAFAGAAIKGGVVAPRKEFNEAYYGAGATPDQIIRAAYNRPADRGLRVALSDGGGRRTSAR